jgi:hypothetical protein
VFSKGKNMNTMNLTTGLSDIRETQMSMNKNKALP